MARNSLNRTVGCPGCQSPTKTQAPAPRVLSFLVRAVVTGIGQARHVEFDRVAAFVASGRKATKDETAQGQNDTAHLSSPGLARMRDRGLSQDYRKIRRF